MKRLRGFSYPSIEIISIYYLFMAENKNINCKTAFQDFLDQTAKIGYKRLKDLSVDYVSMLNRPFSELYFSAFRYLTSRCNSFIFIVFLQFLNFLLMLREIVQFEQGLFNIAKYLNIYIFCDFLPML